MGIHYEPSLGYVYSIGEDGVFTLSDSAAFSKVVEIHPEQAMSLKTLFADTKNQRLIIGDGSGWIYFYSISSHPPSILGKIKTQNQ